MGERHGNFWTRFIRWVKVNTFSLVRIHLTSGSLSRANYEPGRFESGLIPNSSTSFAPGERANGLAALLQEVSGSSLTTTAPVPLKLGVPSMFRSEYARDYMGWFKSWKTEVCGVFPVVPVREKIAHELTLRYYASAEWFDRTVRLVRLVSGDEVRPQNSQARTLHKALVTDAARFSVSYSDLTKARRGVQHLSTEELDHMYARARELDETGIWKTLTEERKYAHDRRFSHRFLGGEAVSPPEGLQLDREARSEARRLGYWQR